MKVLALLVILFSGAALADNAAAPAPKGLNLDLPAGAGQPQTTTPNYQTDPSLEPPVGPTFQDDIPGYYRYFQIIIPLN